MHTEGLLENNSIYIAGKIIEECEFNMKYMEKDLFI